jgi:hypothetical protein
MRRGSFFRAPSDIATALSYTGIDPFTGEEIFVAKGLRYSEMHRALMQFFEHKNYFMVRQALLTAGRRDLIGSGCEYLIPAQAPKAALEARKRRASEVAEGGHDHSMANPVKGEPAGVRGFPEPGHRPGRKSARRQDRRRKRTEGRSLQAAGIWHTGDEDVNDRASRGAPRDSGHARHVSARDELSDHS